MGRVVKRSLSFPEDVFAEIEAEAREQGVSVSAYVTRAARDQMIRERGLRAVAEYEAEYGAFTPEELAEADRILDEAGL